MRRPFHPQTRHRHPRGPGNGNENGNRNRQDDGLTEQSTAIGRGGGVFLSFDLTQSSPVLQTLRASQDLGAVAAENAGRPVWPLVVSLAAHALLLLVLTFVTVARPLHPQTPVSIDVEILSNPPGPAPQTIQAPPVLQAPMPAANTTAPQVAPARPKTAVAPAEPPPTAGMTHPTHLLAQAYIREPASLEIRQNLPKLAPSERVTQICNIEAGQQIRAADAKVFVDSVHASALGDTTVDGLTITAPQAAYRSHRQWYSVSFICTVAADFKSVTDFKFKVGAAIPRELWDAHALNAADENE
jgi:hypothetical protein